jgi:hypothetical protein
MKKMILSGVILTSMLVNGQIAFKITAGTTSKVEFLETTETDENKNQLIINNQFEQDGCTVSLRGTQNSVFTLIFGKNGKMSLKKGDNTFQFNSSGVVRGYPLASQKLSFPFDLTINNSDGKTLHTETVEKTGGGHGADIKKVDTLKNIGLTKVPVYDALILRNYKNITRREFVEILDYYLNEKKIAADSLFAAYTENEFLKDFIKEALDYYGSIRDLSGTGIFGDFIGAGLSSIGGLDVTNFADGAAKFIVKRAKQELSIAFFQKLKKVIRETRDLGTVFPQTANLLEGLDEEIYEYEKYIQNLREAFKKDIQDIHRNLPGIIDNHPGFFSEHQEVKVALLTACYTAQELEDQSHPGDILSNYPIEYLDSIKNKNYKGAIQTIQLLSASLRDTSAKDDATYWVNIKQIRELVNDKLALKIYLGLLLQEAKFRYSSVAFQGTTLVELLNKVADEYEISFGIYNSYRTYILRFGEKVEALNKMIMDQSKENTSDSVAVEKYAKYFRTAVDLVQYSVEICRLPIIKEQGHFEGFPLLLKKYFDVAYSSADLVVDIARKNYSSAINHAVHIYNLVTVKSEEGIPVPQNDEHRNILSDSQVIKNDIKDKSGNTTAIAPQDFKPTSDKLIKYGNFMATVATAKNSDEVEKAIETAALPVGSSRIKRVSDFNVSLNTYAGLFYGIERIKGIDSGAAKFNAFGVAAPIGVAASFGHSLFFFPTGKSEWSTSIFVSLIDLGAIAAFRFRDDSTAQVPSIELKDIFSPGAFLSIGIPKTPLSFNLGVQVGPNLRKVGDGKNDYGNNVYWRYSASLCVDIPVLNFYAKSK